MYLIPLNFTQQNINSLFNYYTLLYFVFSQVWLRITYTEHHCANTSIQNCYFSQLFCKEKTVIVSFSVIINEDIMIADVQEK